MPLDVTQHKIQGYGWKRDLPDIRDARRARPAITALPKLVDLATSPHMPPIYDQLQLGACTAHGIKAAVEFENHTQIGAFLDPSRLFIYFCERVIENTVDQDSGAQIRDGMKAVAKAGIPPETAWPYDITTFATPPKPFADLEAEAQKYDVVTSYERVTQGEFTIKEALASSKLVVFGFSVYPDFESDKVAQTGVVPMPDPTQDSIGGHCVALVGYDDSTGHFKVRNSWNTSWGDQGYCYMPYGYVTNGDLASDFWVASLTSAQTTA